MWVDDINHILHNKIQLDVPLKNYSWFKVGGKAKYFFSPLDKQDLEIFLKNKPKDINIIVLGAGSNILIRDEGVDACVLRLNNLCSMKFIGNYYINVSAGVMNTSVSAFAKTITFDNLEDLSIDHMCLGGFEFLSGIPGTIGGGIFMNAGAFGSEFKDIIHDVTAFDLSGNEIKFNLDQLGLDYRKNSLVEPFIFLEATLYGYPKLLSAINQTMDNIRLKREDTQPKKFLLEDPHLQIH
jgi:UDP-N-acetylmuramate dehydrogenase